MEAIHPSAQVVEAPVRRVTVMEDRAQVERRGRLHLTAGRHLLEVQHVSPLVVDRTVRGAVSGGGAKVADARVVRESTVESTRPELEREIRAKLRELRVQHARAMHRVRVAEESQRAAVELRGFLLEAAGEQAGRGVERTEAWRRDLEELDRRLEEAADEAQARAHEAEDLDESRGKLERRLWQVTQPTTHYWANLQATVAVEEEGDYELVLEYLVPCAVWRPSHQAELSGQTLRWTSFGTVWQSTGEAWEEVALRLSTERPTLGADLPLLDEDLLALRDKSDAERQQVEVSSRDEDIEVVAPGVEPAPRLGLVPGVDDGGEDRVFELEGLVTIPSDGRAHHVPVGGFEVEAEVDLVALPELTEAVLLRSQQTNAGSAPILAGPVRLIQDGGFMGQGQVGFVAPAEQFALGWGSLDDVQVARRTGQHSEAASLTRRARHTLWCRVYLSNTGAQERRVTVTERIPVSELEEVEVELVQRKTTPGFAEGRDGHLTWEIELGPRAQEMVEITLAVHAHRKVVWR